MPECPLIPCHAKLRKAQEVYLQGILCEEASKMLELERGKQDTRNSTQKREKADSQEYHRDSRMAAGYQMQRLTIHSDTI